MVLQTIEWQDSYPMDFYSNDSLGVWTPNNEANRPARPARRTKPKIETSSQERDVDKKTDDKSGDTDPDVKKTEPEGNVVKESCGACDTCECGKT